MAMHRAVYGSNHEDVEDVGSDASMDIDSLDSIHDHPRINHYSALHSFLMDPEITRLRVSNTRERTSVNPRVQNRDENDLVVETSSESSVMLNQGGEQDDTTTTFEEEENETNDNSDTTTMTADGNEEITNTTTDYSDSSSQESRQRADLTICAASSCRNRPAVGCTNSLCGRCCVLIGNYHCPRHNS